MPILHDLTQAGEIAKEPGGLYSAVTTVPLLIATS
jgi:hypothetical protein